MRRVLEIMTDYAELKGKIRQRLEIVQDTLQGLEQKGLAEAGVADRWRDQLHHVGTSLQDSLLRVGVVGSVKSGKSTLINSLLGKDLLKRGAGIVTAFITRVRTDRDVAGWVELKSLPSVQMELNRAVRMLPLLQEGPDSEGDRDFHVEKAEDRRELRQRLHRIQTEWQQAQGRLDANFILLNAFLDGYDRVSGELGEEPRRLRFDASSLGEHRRYVGVESQAVYVRDMELHHPLDWIDGEMEIADCQGSDSPNPAHFALQQQYLLRSHFILYVVGSRTGLREADFKLLDFIKTLRMFPRTLFILNADLDSHPHVDDLLELEARVRTELQWVVPDPRVFTFSALYHLIHRMGESASDRDGLRLELWREEKPLARLSEEGFAAFQDHFREKIAAQRTRILLGSGLGRLSMVAGAVADRARTQTAFLDRDQGSLKEVFKQLQKKQNALHSTLGALDHAIQGFKDSLRKEMDDAVQRYFDLSYSPLVQETLNTVEHYPMGSQYLHQLSDSRKLVRLLHRFYMDFRLNLSRYLVERVNAQVIELAKEQEALLHERLEHSSRAFWSLFLTAHEELRGELARLGIQLQASSEPPFSPRWIPADEVTPPPFSAFVEEEAMGQSALLFKFGVGRLGRFFARLKARLTGGRRDEETAVNLQEAVKLIKSETKEELKYAFRDYRNNFKYAYLFRLLEESTQRLREEFKTRVEMARVDLQDFARYNELEEERKREVMEVLQRAGHVCRAMADELETFRREVDEREALKEPSPASGMEPEPLGQASTP